MRVVSETDYAGFLEDNRLINWCAACGKIESVKWLHEVGVAWNTEIMLDTISEGQFEMTKWLTDTDCPRDYQYMLHTAAQYGCLEILQWLVAGGHLVDTVTVRRAIIGGRLEVLEWIAQQGSLPRDDPSLIERAAERTSPEVIKWLREQGCTWNSEALCAALNYKRPDVVQYLAQNHCPWNQRAVNLLKMPNNREIAWLALRSDGRARLAALNKWSSRPLAKRGS